MLEACQQYVVAKQSNLTHWHPILGWLAQKVDTPLQETISYVKLQVAGLWTGRIVLQLIGNQECFILANLTLIMLLRSNIINFFY